VVATADDAHEEGPQAIVVGDLVKLFSFESYPLASHRSGGYVEGILAEIQICFHSG
jgi:hypothetical protein